MGRLEENISSRLATGCPCVYNVVTPMGVCCHYERPLLKLILDKWNGVWIECIWSGVQTNDRLCWTLKWAFGFHKMEWLSRNFRELPVSLSDSATNTVTSLQRITKRLFKMTCYNIWNCYFGLVHRPKLLKLLGFKSIFYPFCMVEVLCASVLVKCFVRVC
jgi:hypothetical protein